jgi:hypothetical protein
VRGIILENNQKAVHNTNGVDSQGTLERSLNILKEKK